MNNERVDFLKKDYVQGFPGFLGIKALNVQYGKFHARLDIKPQHTQRDGFVHAGVIATMADHTGGYAAYTTVTEEIRILSIEFKINYFKPAAGDAIVCESTVISKGKTLIVSESELFSLSGDTRKLVSKAIITFMALKKG